VATRSSGAAETTDRTASGARYLAQVGARLRELRGDESQRGLAARTGLSPTTIGQLEEGKHEPRLGTMLALKDAFRLGSIEELIGPMPSTALVASPTEAAGSGEG
jgi:transcriptional regulator with XRE-family HTH domain